jgi:hypothetical protein
VSVALPAYKNLMRRDAEAAAARVTELLKAEHHRLMRVGNPRIVASPCSPKDSWHDAAHAKAQRR